MLADTAPSAAATQAGGQLRTASQTVLVVGPPALTPTPPRDLFPLAQQLMVAIFSVISAVAASELTKRGLTHAGSSLLDLVGVGVLVLVAVGICVDKFHFIHVLHSSKGENHPYTSKHLALDVLDVLLYAVGITLVVNGEDWTQRLYILPCFALIFAVTLLRHAASGFLQLKRLATWSGIGLVYCFVATAWSLWLREVWNLTWVNWVVIFVGVSLVGRYFHGRATGRIPPT